MHISRSNLKNKQKFYLCDLSLRRIYDAIVVRFFLFEFKHSVTGFFVRVFFNAHLKNDSLTFVNIFFNIISISSVY